MMIFSLIGGAVVLLLIAFGAWAAVKELTQKKGRRR